jgi:hypothetical protein
VFHGDFLLLGTASGFEVLAYDRDDHIYTFGSATNQIVVEKSGPSSPAMLEVTSVTAGPTVAFLDPKKMLMLKGVNVTTAARSACRMIITLPRPASIHYVHQTPMRHLPWTVPITTAGQFHQIDPGSPAKTVSRPGALFHSVVFEYSDPGFQPWAGVRDSFGTELLAPTDVIYFAASGTVETPAHAVSAGNDTARLAGFGNIYDPSDSRGNALPGFEEDVIAGGGEALDYALEDPVHRAKAMGQFLLAGTLVRRRRMLAGRFSDTRLLHRAKFLSKANSSEEGLENAVRVFWDKGDPVALLEETSCAPMGDDGP